MSKSKFVPATGVSVLLPYYDSLSRYFTRLPTLKRKILGCLQPHSDQTLLDLGCGTGTLLAEFNQTSPYVQTVGVDIDARVLQLAKAKSASSLLIHGSMESLPLRDQSVDFVYSSMAFHHLIDGQKNTVLGEAWRVGKPQAELLLVDYAASSTAFSAFKFLPVRLLDGWAQTRANIVGDLPKMMSIAGWNNVQERFQLETPLGTIRAYQGKKQA